MGKTNIRKNWDHDVITLATASKVYHITNLCGGESVTIKALVGNSGKVYIGEDSLLTTSNGYELDAGETLTLSLPIEFGRDNCISIYGTAAADGDKICYVKLIDLYPRTSSGG